MRDGDHCLLVLVLFCVVLREKGVKIKVRTGIEGFSELKDIRELPKQQKLLWTNIV